MQAHIVQDRLPHGCTPFSAPLHVDDPSGWHSTEQTNCQVHPSLNLSWVNAGQRKVIHVVRSPSVLALTLHLQRGDSTYVKSDV